MCRSVFLKGFKPPKMLPVVVKLPSTPQACQDEINVHSVLSRQADGSPVHLPAKHILGAIGICDFDHRQAIRVSMLEHLQNPRFKEVFARSYEVLLHQADHPDCLPFL